MLLETTLGVGAGPGGYRGGPRDLPHPGETRRSARRYGTKTTLPTALRSWR
jgi:hypothetical protein